MALAFGASVYDGKRCKIFTASCLDNDAAADLTTTFAANGMTAFQGTAIPLEAAIVATTSSDQTVDWALTALSNTGFTLRKLTAAGAGAAVTVRVTLRVPKGIAG